MTTGSPSTPLRWALCPQLFVWTRQTPSAPALAATTTPPPTLQLALEGLTALAVVSSDEVSTATEASTWRGLALAHPGALLPPGVVGRVCCAMEAAGVPLALASVPGQTLLLFPAPLLGRALATLHQAGIAQLTF